MYHNPPAVVWDAATGERLAELEGNTNFELTSAAFSPDGQRVVTASVEQLGANN